MKEKNEPVLFVNSVSVYRDTQKNNTFKLHRLDDIKVLINMKKEIEVEITCNNKVFLGYIKEITSEDILITTNNKECLIDISSIKNIKIISTK